MPPPGRINAWRLASCGAIATSVSLRDIHQPQMKGNGDQGERLENEKNHEQRRRTAVDRPCKGPAGDTCRNDDQKHFRSPAAGHDVGPVGHTKYPGAEFETL